MESSAIWLLDEKRMNVVIRGFVDLIQTLPDFQSTCTIITGLFNLAECPQR